MIKQALRNLTQHRDHLRLEIAVSASMIAVLYAVAALVENQPLARAFAKVVPQEVVIPAILVLALVLLLLFTIVFLLYLNALLLSRRDREIGMYRLLGMPAGRLGGILFFEALFTGALATAIGIGGGILVSKFIAMVLVRMMHLRLQLDLLISGTAACEIALLFLAVFATMGLLNAWSVRSPLIHFLKTDETDRQPAWHWPRTVGAVAGILLLAGEAGICTHFLRWQYHLGQQGLIFAGGHLLLVVVIASTLGIALFFRDSLPFCLHLLQKSRYFHQDARRLLTLTGLRRRLRRNLQSLWLTAMLAALTMTVLGGAATLFQYSQNHLDDAVPFSAAAAPNGQKVVDTALAKYPGAKQSQVAADSKLTTGSTFLQQTSGEAHVGSQIMQVLSQSSYNRVRKVQPRLPRLSLKGNEAALSMPDADKYAHWKTSRKPAAVTIGSMHFKVAALNTHFPLGSGIYFQSALVVTDRAYQQLPGQGEKLQAYQLRKNHAGRQAVAYLKKHQIQDFAAVQQTAGQKRISVRDQMPKGVYGQRFAVKLQQPQAAQSRALFGFGLFIAVMIGAMFMVATASILMLKQVAIAQKEQRQRQVLLPLGMPEQHLRQTLKGETYLIFGLPLAGGVFNTLCWLSLINRLAAIYSGWLVAVVILVYTAVYLAFAWATAKISSRSLTGR